jgi:hypothetical protein
MTPEEIKRRRDLKYRARMAKRTADKMAEHKAKVEAREKTKTQEEPQKWNLPISLLQPWK